MIELGARLRWAMRMMRMRKMRGTERLLNKETRKQYAKRTDRDDRDVGTNVVLMNKKENKEKERKGEGKKKRWS